MAGGLSQGVGMVRLRVGKVIGWVFLLVEAPDDVSRVRRRIRYSGRVVSVVVLVHVVLVLRQELHLKWSSGW